MRFLLAAVLFANPAFACPGLELTDGWIREAPPGATVMAAYATLRNSGSAALNLRGARSSDFGAAELHRSVVEDGISRMLRGQILRLPPGGNAALEPGGWHLMLFRPQRDFKAGDAVAITLNCGDAAKTYTFTVKNESK